MERSGMVCGACGAKIADKAIVCYRCGRATAIPVVERPLRKAPAGSPRPWVLIASLVAVAGAIWWFVPDAPDTATLRTVGVLSAAVFLALAVFFTLRRPGPRP